MISNKRKFLKCITFKQFIINLWNFNRANYNKNYIFINSVHREELVNCSPISLLQLLKILKKKMVWIKFLNYTTSGPINN